MSVGLCAKSRPVWSACESEDILNTKLKQTVDGRQLWRTTSWGNRLTRMVEKRGGKVAWGRVEEASEGRTVGAEAGQ